MILIITVHYGSDLSLLKHCVKSFLKNEKDINFLIVNNNDTPIKSSDVSNDKRVVVLNAIKNLGYGGGFNLAIGHPLYEKAKAIMLVNSDTYLKKPIINRLSKVLEDASVGIAGPVIEYIKADQKTFDLGGYINKSNGSTFHHELHNLSSRKDVNVDFLGVCLLIKKSLIRQLKGFDESFFLYYEDVDFCLRAKEKGYRVIVDPTVSIFHYQSKIIGKDSKIAVYNQTRSAIVYMRKHLGNKSILFFIYLFAQSIKRFFDNPLTGSYAFKAMIETL